MRQPIVFVSHASEDKDRFVVEFAKRLRSNGIDAWVDQWEIKIGDSLVRKLFDEGLRNAEAVIIVISKSSIVKPWVRKELDQSVVRQVQDGTRLIPIVIDDCEVPAPLRDTLWVKIQNLSEYDAEFQRILHAIYNHTEKPPLGPPPAFVFDRGVAIHGLSSVDVLVLKLACESVLLRNDKFVLTSELQDRLQSLDIGSEQMEESLDVLIRDAYFESDSLTLRQFMVTTFGFHEYLRVYYSNYDSAVIGVASSLINGGIGESNIIAQNLAISPTVVEHILDTFEERGFLTQTKTLGGSNQAHDLRPGFKRWFSERTHTSS